MPEIRPVVKISLRCVLVLFYDKWLNGAIQRLFGTLSVIMANSKACVFSSLRSQPRCVYYHSLANYSTSNLKAKIERAAQRLMEVGDFVKLS